MNNSTPLTLYHVTNRVSAERMLIEGMGLTTDDYAKLYDRVRDYFNVPSEALIDIVPPIDPQLDGGVWFYTSLEAALQNKALALSAGHKKGIYLERLVRACARFTKLPYTQCQAVKETLSGELSEPVVVTVEIDASQLLDPSKYAACSEVVTKNKVSSEAILKVTSIM